MLNKSSKLFIIALLMVVLVSCASGGKFVKENGNTKYKKQDGSFVTNDWVKDKNDYYFFDMNGFLVTDDWINNDYYVDKNGKMVKNLWKEHNGNNYYLKDDGMYARNEVLDIDKNKFAFDEAGIIRTNTIALDHKNNKLYFFGSDGKAVTSKGFYAVGDTYVFINDDGSLSVNEWKEDGGKWYFIDANGFMLKNSLVEGGFYVDENGEMVKNKEIKINNTTYIFDENGNGKVKEVSSSGGSRVVRTADLRQLYQLYCHPANDASSTAYYKFAYITPNSDKLEFLGKPYDYQIILSTAEKINSALGVPHVTASMRNTTPQMGLQKQIVSTNLEISWSVTDETTTSGTSPSIWVQYKKY